MIKVTAVLSSKNITTLGEPCHIQIVRTQEINNGGVRGLWLVDQGENVTMTEIIIPTSQIGQREVSSRAEYNIKYLS